MAYRITEDCSGCGGCKALCPVYAVDGMSKQQHVINTKRCVECGVCGRICPKTAVEDASGNRVAGVPRKEWAKPVIDTNICSACGICVQECRSGALRIALPAFQGDIHVSAELADDKKCVACRLCQKHCPLHAIAMTPTERKG